MNFENLLEHTTISILGWFLGTILGLGVGFVLVRLWHKIDHARKKSHPLTFFIPWRTFIVSLLLLNFFPIIPILLFGLGSKANILSVAYVVFFLTIVIVCNALQGTFEPIMQISSWSRTLAVFSVIFAIHYGMWGGGGLGLAARNVMGTLEFDTAWTYIWLFSGIALVIDEVTGFIHWLIYSYANRTSTQTMQNAA